MICDDEYKEEEDMVSSILLTQPRVLSKMIRERIEATERAPIHQRVEQVSRKITEMTPIYGFNLGVTRCFGEFFLRKPVDFNDKEAYESFEKNRKYLIERYLGGLEKITDKENIEAIADYCAYIDVQEDKSGPLDEIIKVLAGLTDGLFGSREARILMLQSRLSVSHWVRWFNPEKGTITLSDDNPFVARYQQRIIDWWEAKNIFAHGGDYFGNNFPSRTFNIIFAVDFLRRYNNPSDFARFFAEADRLLGFKNIPGTLVVVDEQIGLGVSQELKYLILVNGMQNGFCVHNGYRLNMVADGKQLSDWRREMIVFEQCHPM